MLNRTRVSRTMDVGRLAQAVSRPGIDPRIWSSLAIVTAVNVDPEHGPLVDVQMIPTNSLGTARVGAEYAGNGFGVYAPIVVDDEVVVEAPSGDPAEGLVVMRRLWSAADPPPVEAVDYPEDLLIHVQDGKTIRIVVSGGGKVLVGGPDADQQMMLGNVWASAMIELLTTGVLHAPDGPVFVDQSWITKYVTDPSTNALSQKAFTERGP